MNLKFTRQLPDNPRTEIVQAIQLIVQRYLDGESYTSIDIPPRYGKSAIIRLTALEINALTRAPVVMTAPWKDNVDQIKDTKKTEETFKTYGIPLTISFSAHRITALPTHSWWKLVTGVPTLLTCTLGLINNKSNRQQFLDGLCDIRDRFKCRPVFLIDEAHLIKTLQQWGQFVEKVVKESDTYVVVLTGTTVPGIPGFECKYGDWKDFVRKIPRRKFENGKVKYVREEWEGQRREVTDIEADISVLWRHAWDIGALARVNVAWTNTDVSDTKSNEPLGPLSDLPQQALNGRIKEIMESPDIMSQMAKIAVRRLVHKRLKYPSTQGIVFTGADEFNLDTIKSSVDKHAKKFRQLLKEEADVIKANLRIEIATGNVHDADAVVKSFRNGEIDILIVKMMGAVGLDVPPCKVLVWLSRMRSGPLAIQALSRVLTTWGNSRADMILPKDKRMVDLYDRVVRDQGGEYHEAQSHLVGAEEYEPEERFEWNFEGTRIDAYGDERGNNLVGEFEDVLEIIKQKYDTFGLSDLQIISNYQRSAFPVSEEEREHHAKQKEESEASAVIDLDEELKSVKGTFGEEAKKITNRHLNYSTEPELWKKKNRELMGVAKEMCKVPKHIRVPNLDDVELLKRLVKSLDYAENKIFRN